MAKKVSLINMKGGVGKSTLTVNLAWHFTLRPDCKRVLVVDLDPQFNASQYLLGPNEYRRILQGGKRTVWDIFERGTRHPQVAGAAVTATDVIHNRVTIRPEGARLDVILSRLELAFSLKTPYAQKERQLAQIIASVEDEYDLILIDCAPTESILTTAAYLASDYLLVPVKPEYLSSIGLPLLVQSMTDFHAAYPGQQLELAGIVFNATTEYSPEEMLAKADVRGVAQQHDWNVFDAEVTYSRSYPKSARLGVSIYSTPNAHKSKMRHFGAFAREFAQRIGL